jgi:hypothetical protein
MARAETAMATAKKVVCMARDGDKGQGGKGNSNNHEDGRQQQA